MLVFRKKEGREGESLAEGAMGTEGQMDGGGLCRVAGSVTEVCAWMGVRERLNVVEAGQQETGGFRARNSSSLPPEDLETRPRIQLVFCMARGLSELVARAGIESS